MEIGASVSAAPDQPIPPITDGTHPSDDREISGNDDDRVVLKPVISHDQEDKEMKDVDSKVSDDKDVNLMDADLVVDGGEVGDLRTRVSEEENEGIDLDVQASGDDEPVELSVSISGSDVRDEDSEGEGEDRSVSRYDSLLSKFDSYAGGGSGSYKSSTFGFKVGDLVWGKVKSHPWWPGHIYNEAFASSSIRRTRREGHIMVAFFGDNSYGWFDPVELVPFDEHFAEKSRQTNAKSFVKAVEEAVDEVCRRRALGVSCRCRNPQNFRHANEEGYFAIDLDDYDYVAVYPQSLIDQTRDRFQPLETIRLVSQLAKKPFNRDHKSLDLSENKAVVLQLRKAMFEEFDDTYSEAFGYPPERPIRAPKNLRDDSLRVQAQAQLSGPLVIAEALRGKKNTKPVKSKDKSKRNKYLLKRRDGTDVSKESSQLNSSAPLSYVDGKSELASDDYVLQRRSPSTPTKTNILPIENVESVDQTTLMASVKNEYDTPSEMKASNPSNATTKSTSYLQNKAEEATDLKHNDSASVVNNVENVNKLQKTSTTVLETHSLQPVDSVFHPETKVVVPSKKVVINKSKVPKGPTGETNSGLVVPEEKEMKKPIASKRPVGEMSSGMTVPEEKQMKKPKVPKRPAGQISSDIPEERKMKKKKIKKETMEGYLEKRLPNDRADLVVSLEDGKEKERTSAISHGALMNAPVDASANTDLKFRDVLSDLKIFALDPFHGAERNSLVMAKQMFLKFRSLVYQKSLLLAPTSESDSVSAEISKHATTTIIPDTVHNANIKEKSIKKPFRPPGRPDDPTKGGRKRPLSDRQEENAMKKSKKISDIKSLANEKKAGRKLPEPDQTSILGPPPKVSKVVPPPRRPRLPLPPTPRVPEPTMLVLKFPQGTTMPTSAALKARFARFGPLDLESLRVFWQSSTCRVVFRYKADAQQAYEFAVANTALFGNGNVRCLLREVEVLEQETKEETKEEAYPDLPRYNPPLPPSSQLKSILKKSPGDETGRATAPSKASPRVKFVLDGEESSRGEQAPMMASRNFVNGNNITSFGDSRTPSNSVAMEYNSRNLQKVIQSSSTSTLPPTTNLHVQHQFSHNVHYSEAPTIRYHPSNYGGGGAMPAGPSTPMCSVDISQQMISMLTRCNEVVSNIKAHLGYVPYHTL